MKLGMIHSDSEAEEYSELMCVGTISDKPSRCMIDTGANHTTVQARLIQPISIPVGLRCPC